ncbi:MAG: MBL fold metallo-hydrolase [Firmicutes bacterium]|nr:MBL fold metallo-hydrolase [Bacillota bacterium]
MEVKRFAIDLPAVNCYLVFEGKEGLIIDPGKAAPEVLEFIRRRQLEIKAIINTHGHADHIGGNSWFINKTKAPLWIHEADAAFLGDPNLNLAPFLRQEFPHVVPDRLLKDRDEFKVGATVFQILHTPGHSPGSVSLYSKGILFSGDTLFKSSVGRWDLPGGDRRALQESVLKLGRLPLETKVYPGHGEATTIEEEIKKNPFL